MDHQTSSYSVVIGSPTARSVYSITITNLSNIVNLFLCPCGLANAIKSQIRLFLRLPRPCLINYKYQHLTRVSSIANISPYYCKIGICRTIVEAMSGYNTHQEGPHLNLQETHYCLNRNTALFKQRPTTKCYKARSCHHSPIKSNILIPCLQAFQSDSIRGMPLRRLLVYINCHPALYEH